MRDDIERDCIRSSGDRIEARARALFEEHRTTVLRQMDRMFAWLIFGQWILAIGIALIYSPYTWSGKERAIHQHVEIAVVFGGLASVLPIFLAARRPGWIGTRMVIATSQMLWSATLIHLTGGRIETHFHVFGSLAFLAFYRDWRVLVPATLVVGADHFLRGMFWPESVYGISNPEWWRFLEHVFWVAFIDVFLVMSCIRGTREMREIARRRAQIEALSETLEHRVFERTAQVAEAQEIAHLGSWDWDLGTDDVVCSDELRRIFGLAPEGPVTFEALVGCVHPEDRRKVEGAIERSWSEGQSFTLEHRVVRPDGSVRAVLARGRPIVVAKGAITRMVGTAADITEQKALEAKLSQQEKLSAIGQLAAGVAHEINNPLAVILGFAQVLETRLECPERYAVTSIVRETVRCKTLVQTLLAFSRSRPNTMQDVDLNLVVQDSSLLLEARAKMQSVTVALELAAGAPIVRAHRGQLEQILVNLGTNALDAMSEGGTLTLRTRVEGGGRARVDVLDVGCGISEDVRGRMFEPFFTTKEVGKGTGLGLSLVYEIVQQHGGTIEIESAVGEGTTVSVALPLSKACGAPPEAWPMPSVSIPAA